MQHDSPTPAPLSARLRDVMQDAWNDFCSDTGHHPDCFSRKGASLYADFGVGNFAEMVAARLECSLSARVAELEAAQERATGTIRELSAACHARAEERNEARYLHTNAVVEDLENREAMAGALGMSWDGCDPFKWPEIIARANELRTTLKMRPDWQARATQAEALLSELARLTGAESHAAAVGTVATMLAGADATAYGGVVRAYAEMKAALSASQAREAGLREQNAKLFKFLWRGLEGTQIETCDVEDLLAGLGLVEKVTAEQDGEDYEEGDTIVRLTDAGRAALSPAQPAQSADPLVTAYDNGVEHAWSVARPLAEALNRAVNEGPSPTTWTTGSMKRRPPSPRPAAPAS
ncbi:hypothetical protein ACW7BJ_16115 [Azospirillum argentinense]